MSAGFPFQIEILTRWEQVAPHLEMLLAEGNATPFQTSRWLGEWFLSLGAARKVEPLFVLVRREDQATLQMLLSLIRFQSAGLMVIEAPDLGITDYNAPILAKNVHFSADEAQSLWKAIRLALPPADILRLTKTPELIEGRGNPLAMLRQAGISPLNGNILSINGPWSEYHHGFERSFRKEIERSWRVFLKPGNTRFRMVSDIVEARSILIQLEQQQAARMAELGQTYILDEPEIARFYRNLLENGLTDGSVRLAALLSGSEVVAALLGITRGATFSMVRLSTGSVAWRNCSPGRLIIYKMMEALHAEGFTKFDFTIGDYAYKRRMGVEPMRLYNLIEARSLRGLPLQIEERLRFRLQRSPTWRKVKLKLRGKG